MANNNTDFNLDTSFFTSSHFKFVFENNQLWIYLKNNNDWIVMLDHGGQLHFNDDTQLAQNLKDVITSYKQKMDLNNTLVSLTNLINNQFVMPEAYNTSILAFKWLVITLETVYLYHYNYSKLELTTSSEVTNKKFDPNTINSALVQGVHKINQQVNFTLSQLKEAQGKYYKHLEDSWVTWNDYIIKKSQTQQQNETSDSLADFYILRPQVKNTFMYNTDNNLILVHLADCLNAINTTITWDINWPNLTFLDLIANLPLEQLEHKTYNLNLPINTTHTLNVNNINLIFDNNLIPSMLSFTLTFSNTLLINLFLKCFNSFLLQEIYHNYTFGPNYEQQLHDGTFSSSTKINATLAFLSMESLKLVLGRFFTQNTYEFTFSYRATFNYEEITAYQNQARSNIQTWINQMTKQILTQTINYFQTNYQTSSAFPFYDFSVFKQWEDVADPNIFNFFQQRYGFFKDLINTLSWKFMHVFTSSNNLFSMINTNEIKLNNQNKQNDEVVLFPSAVLNNQLSTLELDLAKLEQLNTNVILQDVAENHPHANFLIEWPLSTWASLDFSQIIYLDPKDQTEHTIIKNLPKEVFTNKNKNRL